MDTGQEIAIVISGIALAGVIVNSVQIWSIRNLDKRRIKREEGQWIRQLEILQSRLEELYGRIKPDSTGGRFIDDHQRKQIDAIIAALPGHLKAEANRACENFLPSVGLKRRESDQRAFNAAIEAIKAMIKHIANK
jgi:hypothetical protein